MRRSLMLVLALLSVASPAPAVGPPPPGYAFTRISAGVPDNAVLGITQLAFLPGDPGHLFAARITAGAITRYDYALDGTLSNPVAVASGLPAPVGLAFRGTELYVSLNPSGDGRIARLRDLDHDGSFEERVDFVRGIPIGQHQVDQLQIRGSSLYAGIGTRTNGGLPSCERVYAGVIARIADLAQVDFATGANYLPDSAQFVDPVPGDGYLRRYARGLRNPFGLRVDSLGQVWASDNGASACNTCSSCNRFAIDTPDFLYGPIALGAKGQFPPAGYPGGGGATLAPLADLGYHPTATGFTFVARGPDTGQILLAEYGPTDTSLAVGRAVVMVDPSSGLVRPFMQGFSGPTEIATDPDGRLLIVDYAAPALYLLTAPASTSVESSNGRATARFLPTIERLTPNPSAGDVRIEYSLPDPAFVSLTVCDLQGRELSLVRSGSEPRGKHAAEWDGRDRTGRPMPAGTYFVTLKTDRAARSRSFTLIR